MSSTDIPVVIPIYNERENIEPLHRSLTSVFAALSSINISYEIIFANDGSIDGSDRKLDALAQTDSRVKVVHLKRNYG
jgi:glycosyltransferase involved in cell wall biosynthesis